MNLIRFWLVLHKHNRTIRNRFYDLLHLLQRFMHTPQQHALCAEDEKQERDYQVHG